MDESTNEEWSLHFCQAPLFFVTDINLIPRLTSNLKILAPPLLYKPKLLYFTAIL